MLSKLGYHTTLIGNHTISRSIWNDLHECVLQRVSKLHEPVNFQIDLETVLLPLQIIHIT